MDALLVRGASGVLTCQAAANKDVDWQPNSILAVQDGTVVFVGPEEQLPSGCKSWQTVDAAGGFVGPGLVDPHSHPIFGGSREKEFAQRARGATYQDIARAGGGIAATMAATRNASDEQLCHSARQRFARSLQHGVTTIEAKTGYALSLEGELRLLRLLGQLNCELPQTIIPTLLGAHLPPPDIDRGTYVELCASTMLDGAKGQACSVDVYCDDGAFSLAEARTILSAAKDRGFAVRAHVGQFTDLGGAGLVAQLGGVSADHLEATSQEQAIAMARAGTVAVLLPGAAVQLRCPAPPVEMLRASGCCFALGTDLNPGSSNTANLPLMMWLAMTHFALTLEETWLAVTRIGARAAGRPKAGQISPGAPADFVVWRCASPEALPYEFGENHVKQVFVAGRQVFSNTQSIRALG